MPKAPHKDDNDALGVSFTCNGEGCIDYFWRAEFRETRDSQWYTLASYVPGGEYTQRDRDNVAKIIRAFKHLQKLDRTATKDDLF